MNPQDFLDEADLRNGRVRFLTAAPIRRGAYVLLWMQSAQRADENPALECAIRAANTSRSPVVACFGLSRSYPSATSRHYRFMLEGLQETRSALSARGLDLVVEIGEPPEVVGKLGAHASMVVADGGYTRIQRLWRLEAARRLECPLLEVESNLVVPLEAAYPRLAYSAAVLRPRLDALLLRFLAPVRRVDPVVESRGIVPTGVSLDHVDDVLALLGVPHGEPAIGFRGGSSQARQRLEDFSRDWLWRYEEARKDPTQAATSRLSPYLHFGQIAASAVALRALEVGGVAARAFLEELVVRRELAHNYVWYNPRYDSYEGIPRWARESLARHREDPRPYLYDMDTLEAGRTHDPYWNAAQLQMRLTGWMHGYMRMYWGKKLIEWSASPREAYARAVALNDRYELDGRDPNGYAGIAWCFGTHDRPWKERTIFGTVRYMRGIRRAKHC